jgi:predicted unusual protein kinase regulating ubiquinone biosynthesis (AarF/ABC1/UbiB family)
MNPIAIATPKASLSPSPASSPATSPSRKNTSNSPPLEAQPSALSKIIGWWGSSPPPPNNLELIDDAYDDEDDMELILPNSKKPGASHLVRVARTTKLGSMMLPILKSYRECQLKLQKLRKQEKDDATFERLREEMMDAQHASQSKAMKNILVTMGGLYNKGAQLAASQQLIMPAALVEELKTCFEDMPARDWKLIAPSIHKCLGKGDKKKGKEVMETEFLEFEQKPLAAASIGQVHLATLRSRQRVVVKILYPEIRKHMYADLATIETTINMIATVLELGDLKGIIEMLFKELNDNFPREMDFNIELAHMEYARKLLSRHSKQIVVPTAFPELSGTTMLTQQMVEGETINKIAKENNPEKMAKAQNAFDLVIDALGEMIFRDGFFHGKSRHLFSLDMIYL